MSAFSFVDAITEFEPARRARGVLALPADCALPPCLIAEAVGQLAAWVAMAHTDFRRRPVAALANEVRICTPAAAGNQLHLEVAVETCETDAVSYGGRALLHGATVLELNGCVGPMLAMEEFDDPARVRRRFAQLHGTEAPPPRTAATWPVPSALAVVDREPGKRIGASVHVPVSAPLFADHFPRRPLFPGTLLLDALIRLALQLAAESIRPPTAALLQPTRVHQVKLRAFVEPGQQVRLAAQVLSCTAAGTEFGLAADIDGRRIATARLECREWAT